MIGKLNFNQFVHDFYQILSQFDQSVSNLGLNKIQQELIKIRASQINKCGFCLNIHIKKAIKYGENPKRIHTLSAWREEQNLFTTEEQIILALTEELTTISNQGLSSEIYNSAVHTFGNEKTAKIILAVANINGWNRITKSFYLQLF
ncbi:AhpD family alkylhydroperoxidase [Flavobacterium sp. 270]|uniref:carboxymuconolactone decarboxylase family protein n=1 Tax=Flavobacterium sp. 270 TaxID=2512114 RepID=UPI001064DC2B|nr:carboxymuconolactone decarboxylase family protein [Flavobacterium sp. 270]TDW51726.1 AhpD family alkylhydroperoxidase [Flavobacterium sp. 270]